MIETRDREIGKIAKIKMNVVIFRYHTPESKNN